MKARRIRETTGLNPAFVARSYWAAKRAGKEYDIDIETTYKVGTIAEGPGVLVQCALAEPTMVPADEECHAAVKKFLEHPARKAQFAKLKAMADPAVFDKLPKGLQDYVRAVSDKWKDSATAAVTRGEKDFAALTHIEGQTEGEAD